MKTTTPSQMTAFGRHMKQWRRQRGLSQLDLAVRSEISQRHISFIETGRSRPKKNVVQKIAEALEIPLRERNSMLEAAGLAPSYPEMPLTDRAVEPFHNAVKRILKAQEPYPAYVINRYWELVDANNAGHRMFPFTGDDPINSVDFFLAPGPNREMMENFSEVAWIFLRRLKREVANSAPDKRLQDLLERAENYLKDVPPTNEDFGSDLVACPRLRIGDKIIKTVSMVARFGNVREVTLDELRVELIFPGDAASEAFFRQGAQAAEDLH